MIATRRVLTLILLVAGSTSAPAGLGGTGEDDPLIVNSEGFLRGHPDMRWRGLGVFEYNRKRYKDAIGYFRDAARYGDKPSQAMIAIMLWNGDGVDVDRAQAYAWADLAAERGYKSFVATREKFWAALSEDERHRALETGKQLYAKYGDEHAKKRLNFEMTREKIKLTGSHLGRPGTLVVNVPGPDGKRMRPIDASLFYAARYWSPEEYWSWQDQRWEPPQGHVDVGPVQSIEAEPAASEKR